MNVAGKILFVLLLLGLALLGGYGVYTYLLPRWVPIVFYSYVVLGVLVLGMGAARLIAEARAKTAREDTSDLLGRAIVKEGWLHQLDPLRNRLTAIGANIAQGIIWPVSVWNGALLTIRRGQMRVAELAVRTASSLSAHLDSLFTLVVVAGVCALEYRGVHLGRYGTMVLYAMLASVMVRHATYVVRLVPLAAELRRTARWPYVPFLGIIAADLSVLVLGLTAAEKPGMVTAVTLADLRDTFRALMEAQEPLKVIRGHHLSAHQLLVGVAGLLFETALLKFLREFQEFKRQDEDYVWMAQSANQLGNFSIALGHLDHVKGWDAGARMTKAFSLLGVNQIQLAEKEARLALEDSRKDSSVERIFATMWGATMVLPITEEVRVEIFRYGIEQRVRDVLVQTLTFNPAGYENIQPRLAAAVSDVEEQYPLTTASLALLSSTEDGAKVHERLGAAALAAPLDELARLTLGLLASLTVTDQSLEESTANFHAWAMESMPRVRLNCGLVAEPFDRVIALEQIMILLQIAGRVGKDRVEELTFLFDTLRAKAATEAEAVKILKIRFDAFRKSLG